MDTRRLAGFHFNPVVNILLIMLAVPVFAALVAALFA